MPNFTAPDQTTDTLPEDVMDARSLARRNMLPGQVVVIDYRYTDERRIQTVIAGDPASSYEAAMNVSLGFARAFGFGGTSTEVPDHGVTFEVYHNGSHVSDVLAS